MAGITLKYGVLTGKGVALKRQVAGAAISLGVLLSSVGATPNPTPTPTPTPVSSTLGLFSYAPPAGVTGSSCYIREVGKTESVRTLWNNRKETSTASKIERWDGRLYDLSTAPAGKYEVVINYHSLVETYQGGIGNTSLNLADMDSMWRGFDFVHDGLQVGTNIYCLPSYLEGGSWLLRINVNNLQVVEHVFGHESIMSGCTMRRMAYDGTRIYAAFYDTIGSKKSGIIAVTESNMMSVAFSGGTTFKPQYASRNESVIGLLSEVGTNLDNLVHTIAVQVSGNILVATYPALNQVRTFNKFTGAPLKTQMFTTPGGCSFDAQDRLVLTTETNTTAVYTVNSDGLISMAVANYAAGAAKPFSLKRQGNLTLMTDHGLNAQQVRAYNLDGSLAWVHGQAGGQNVTARVAANRFLFSTANGGANWSNIVPLDDGKFLVIEPGNNRMQLFNADRTPVGGRAGVVSYRTAAYTFALNQNNPTDITWKYQRFRTGYSDDILNDWEFTHNYLPFMPKEHFAPAGGHGDQQGLEFGSIFKNLYTDPLNGRTYAYCVQPSNLFQEVEITDTGIRLVGGTTEEPYSFTKTGERVTSRFLPPNYDTYAWEIQPRTGFTSTGDRILGTLRRPITILKTDGDKEPYDVSGYPNRDAYLITEGGYRPLYLPNLVQYFYGKARQDGWRLGLAKEGSSSFNMLLNKTTGGISYWGGQSTEGYYTNGDHGTEVLRDHSKNPAPPILDAKGRQILLSKGYGGSAVRVSGRYLLENVRGEFYHDGQQCQFFLWTEWGTMLFDFGTNTDETRAYTAVTGKRVYPGMSGNAMYTELVRSSDGDTLHVWYSEEAGSGTLNRRKVTGMNTITSTPITTFEVAAGATFAPALPAGGINLLAKIPAKGDMWRPAITVYENPGCGWTQSKPDQGDDRYAGKTFWKTQIGTRTYDIFKPNGIELFFQGDNTTLELVSDPLATTRTGNWLLTLKEQYLDNFANDGEQDTAGTGGIYRHIKDLNGKILLRSYIRNVNFSTIEIIVNGKKLVSGPATPLTALWRKMRQGEDWRIMHIDGVVIVQYSDYPAITITQPFEAGGNFADLKNVSYLAWDRGQKRDRVMSLREADFIPNPS